MNLPYNHEIIQYHLQNNKFYDQNTGQRIFPKDGELFLIAGDNISFGDHDPLNIPHKGEEILNSADKLAEVKEIKHLKTFKLALKAGSDVFFDISINKTKTDYEQLHYGFRIVLLEDLYLYNCTSWGEKKPPMFHDCRCVVVEPVDRNVEFFEQIYATSLNETYSNTFQFYFPNQGTPSGSVYKKMRVNHRKTLEDLRAALERTKWESVDGKEDDDEKNVDTFLMLSSKQ
jgi:hypothetical protein